MEMVLEDTVNGIVNFLELWQLDCHSNDMRESRLSHLGLYVLKVFMRKKDKKYLQFLSFHDNAIG